MGCGNSASTAQVPVARAAPKQVPGNTKDEEPVSQFIYEFKETTRSLHPFLQIQPLSQYGTPPFEIPLGFSPPEGCATAVLSNSIFFTGGKSATVGKETKQVCIDFTKRAAIFKYYPDMLTARYSHAVVTFLNARTIVAISGTTMDSSLTDSCEKLTISNSTGWERVAPIPTKREQFAACTGDGGDSNKVFVFGGIGENGVPIAQIDVYDSVRNQWESVAAGWTGRKCIGAVRGNNKDEIFVFGGTDSDGSDTFMFRVGKKLIQPISIKGSGIKSEPSVVIGMTAVAFQKGRVYCTGTKGKVFVYTIDGSRWSETSIECSDY